MQSGTVAPNPPDRALERDIAPGSAHADRFSQDFSDIPLHSTPRISLSQNPIAAIDSDVDELEANRTAERVIASPVGSERPRTRPSPAHGSGPPTAALAPSSSGRPLDPPTRAFMEVRFGHDFSQVRVHTDGQAAESARALGAKAFTVGPQVVFDPREYSPGTDAGRRLLAHELTHVLQQRSTGSRVQRQPQGNQSPGAKRLPPGPGAYSPDEYKAWLKAHPKREYVIVGPWEPEAFYRRYTPEWFQGKGYVYAGRGGNYPWYWFEVWISSAGAGKEYRVWRTQSEKGKSTSKSGPTAGEGDRPNRTRPDQGNRIDPNADREKLFGRVIAEKHDVDAAFGEGDVVLYDDGTVELFLRGTTQSYVFRPISGGRYLVYGPDGQRLEKPWEIPESDMPDPVDDAVDE